MYDPTEDDNYHDPFMTSSDIWPLYKPGPAAAVARTAMCDQGSGNWKQDD